MGSARAGSISRATSQCSKERKEYARSRPLPGSAPSSRPRAKRSMWSTCTPRERSSSPPRPSRVRAIAPRLKRRTKSASRPTRNRGSPDCLARRGNTRSSGGPAWFRCPSKLPRPERRLKLRPTPRQSRTRRNRWRYPPPPPRHILSGAPPPPSSRSNRRRPQRSRAPEAIPSLIRWSGRFNTRRPAR